MPKVTEEAIETPEWTHVVAYMHARGEFSCMISDDHRKEIYTMADGFGPLGDEIWDTVPEWDWSHIRDSTPDAVKAMSARLKDFGYMPEGPVSPKAPR